jgi:hypothetical protein
MASNAGERDVFKNHVAKYEKHNEHLETLQWKEPGSSTYAIWYVRQYGTLMVWGDCYEATYQWNYQDGFDLKWIARCDEHYFISKCRASPHGREPYDWDSDEARRTLQKHFDEFKDSKYDEDYEEERESRAGELEEFERFDGWRALDSKFEWEMWCWNHAYDVFGGCWYEGVCANPGKVLGPCIPLHLTGLKRAMAQLKEEKDAKIQSDPECAGTDSCDSGSADAQSGEGVGG